MSTTPEQQLDDTAEVMRLEELRATCRALVEQGLTVEAVKRYRVATGCSLRDAQRELGLK